MIPYMDLNEQVDADFTRARRSARLRALVARIRREHASNKLLSFDEVRKAFAAKNRLHRGTRVVGMEEIVGSVGRWDEFDRSFLPVRASMAERWKRIDRAFHRAEDLPPVKLYKLKETYFVVDGHHRVSVARYHDVPTVEAAVVEFYPSPRCTGTHKFEERRKDHVDGARETAKRAVCTSLSHRSDAPQRG